MENIQVRIRVGSAYDGENGVYRNATFAQAVEALQGTKDEDGTIRAQNVYVVGTYVQGFTEDLGTRTKPRPVERKTDEPIFGLEVTIYSLRSNYWGAKGGVHPAEVNWSALGSSTPEVTTFYAGLLTLASQIAGAANASL